MNGIAELMRRRIGGIPVLYIAALITVVLAVVAYRMKRIPDTAGDTPEEPAEDTPDGDGPDVNRVTFTANPNPNLTPSITVEETNETWRRRAYDWILGQNLATPLDAGRILDSYLSGGSLSFDDGAIVNKVLKALGPPPESPTGTKVGAPVAKRQGTPPLIHTVKGVSDDSYGELSSLYYGASNEHDGVDLLQIENPSVGHQGPFAPGTKVKIPRWVRPKYFRATARTKTAREIARRNGISVSTLLELNDGMRFPVKTGTRVRVG